MNALTLFCLIALPCVVFAQVVPPVETDEHTSSAATDTESVKTSESPVDATVPSLETEEREKLLKSLEESTSEDKALLLTAFGPREALAFHCTRLSNDVMFGRSICCQFTSLYLLNCFIPPMTVAYAAAMPVVPPIASVLTPGFIAGK